MVTETKLNGLNANSVSLLTTKVLEDGGETFRMPPHTKAYINSSEGRAELLAEVTEPYLSAILAVWGDAPTVAPSGSGEV